MRDQTLAKLAAHHNSLPPTMMTVSGTDSHDPSHALCTLVAQIIPLRHNDDAHRLAGSADPTQTHAPVEAHEGLVLAHAAVGGAVVDQGLKPVCRSSSSMEEESVGGHEAAIQEGDVGEAALHEEEGAVVEVRQVLAGCALELLLGGVGVGVEG